jgi:hypothetical protein
MHHLPLRRSFYPLEDEAEDDISVDSRSGVLRRVDDGRGHHLPSFASHEHRLPTRGIDASRRSQNRRQQCVFEWSNNIIGGRKRAKRIDIQKHFAHEVIQNGHPRLIRVSTADQLADLFTKSLQPRLHAACLSGILRKQWT